jgi:hypothetical protein
MLIPFLYMRNAFKVQLRTEMSEKFMVPAIIWTDVAQKASGFFGSQDFQADNGNRGYSTYHYVTTLTKN